MTAASGLLALAALVAPGVALSAGNPDTKSPKAPPASAPAAAPAARGGEAPAADGEEASSPRNLTKVRQGSVLRRNEPLADLPDLRGDFERRRDREVIRHYRRLAELDVLEAVARKAGDMPLADRVDEVRRKEKQRYWAVMQYLRQAAQEKAMRGNR